MNGKNIFIGYVNKNNKKLQDLKSLLKAKGYAYRDATLENLNPDNTIDQDCLSRGVKWAGTLILFISPDTRKSKLGDWTIEFAQKNDTRIIGVWALDAKNSDLPNNFDNYGDIIVGWDENKIIDAIEGRIESWETPDGNECPSRSITRYSCS
jgi:hypothetical protein